MQMFAVMIGFFPRRWLMEIRYYYECYIERERLACIAPAECLDLVIFNANVW